MAKEAMTPAVEARPIVALFVIRKSWATTHLGVVVDEWAMTLCGEVVRPSASSSNTPTCGTCKSRARAEGVKVGKDT